MNNRIIKGPVLEVGTWDYTSSTLLPYMIYRTRDGWMMDIGGKEYGPYDESFWPHFNENDSIWTAFVTKAGQK